MCAGMFAKPPAADDVRLADGAGVSGELAGEPGGDQQDDERTGDDPGDAFAEWRAAGGAQGPEAVGNLRGDEQRDQPAEGMHGQGSGDVAVRQVHEAARESAAGAVPPQDPFALADFGEGPVGQQAEGDALFGEHLEDAGGEEDASRDDQDAPVVVAAIRDARRRLC